ncbi:MAG: diaminopimelate epimerase [Clostridia bacterium]|nr:diaminopimelate epimerase [Clostridia bacterium]MBQ8381936.1 diaminopimelate epimerase [Clostridia bacterium]
MHFTKMHGLGNDYLYVYGEVPSNIEELSTKLSERHFGAGSDGMIYISPSKVADFKMRIFNADGSEAKMCGNGIRCVGKYVYDKGYTDKRNLTIETLSGIKTLELGVSFGKVKSVTVDMGQAVPGKDMTLNIDDETIVLTPVSVGNPHAVIFVEDIGKVPLTTLGPKIEQHEAFPSGVNVEFVQVLSDGELRMKVWERGSGVTMACGTGACASATAAVQKKYCEVNHQISVHLDGGTLKILVDRENKVTMTGPAEFVYEGETIE